MEDFASTLRVPTKIIPLITFTKKYVREEERKLDDDYNDNGDEYRVATTLTEA